MTDPGASYAQRLTRRVAETNSFLCVGLDPSLAALELLAGDRRAGGNDRASRAHAIERLCCAIIDAAAPHAAAVKPQLAHFEAAGAAGIDALEGVVAHAHAAGLLVVLDAKRCDIPHSATTYAEAWLGREASSGICGDALTVAVWPGPDTLAAFTEVAQARACGVYALVLTSNPGADAWLNATGTGQEPLWHDVARAVAGAGSSAGAVIPATRPGALARARELMPDTPLLIPGVGAQGGSIEALADVVSPTAPPTLVNASRSLLPDVRLAGHEFGPEVARRARELSTLLHNVLMQDSRANIAHGTPVG